MAKIKTRELILDVALILFNERGEQLVSSVDLADEMNISPGNLYYHYKGKEEVVEELYARFHTNLSAVIEGVGSVDSVDARSMLSYLMIVHGQFETYRFITSDTEGLCARYPRIKTPLVRLLSLLHRQICHVVGQLPAVKRIESFENTETILADNIINTLLHLRASNRMLDDKGEDSGIEEHLQLQLLPFLIN